MEGCLPHSLTPDPGDLGDPRDPGDPRMSSRSWKFIMFLQRYFCVVVFLHIYIFLFFLFIICFVCYVSSRCSRSCRMLAARFLSRGAAGCSLLKTLVASSCSRDKRGSPLVREVTKREPRLSRGAAGRCDERLEQRPAAPRDRNPAASCSSLSNGNYILRTGG